MTITAAATLSTIALRDTLDVVATFETLPTSRGALVIGRDERGRIVEFHGTTGWTYKYAPGPFSTLVTEIAPNGALATFTVPADRQVRELADLFA